MAEWRRAREEMARDIKATAQRAGATEREADDLARRRSDRGMERAVNMANNEGTERPTEL